MDFVEVGREGHKSVSQSNRMNGVDRESGENKRGIRNGIAEIGSDQARFNRRPVILDGAASTIDARSGGKFARNHPRESAERNRVAQRTWRVFTSAIPPPILFLMNIPLEDGATDIIGKAQRGLGLSDAKLADKAGIDADELDAVKQVRGVDFAKVEKLAKALELGPKTLVAIAEGKYQPEVTRPKAGFFQANTPYSDDIRVNAYLVWDAESGLAAAFDTGADCAPLIEEIKKRDLTLQDIYLTHAHVDHVMELDRLIEKAGGSVGVHISEAEALDKAAMFQPGVTFSLGRLHIESRDTSGHSAGGTTYFIHGLDRPLAIVGDALFAGSAGGIKSDYRAALKKIRDNILSAQDNTILAPGHGPLTTVIQEKTSNPFFPGFRRPVGQDI
jgi:glyoxylase-like metal-dependent hydrolase (beta-lactamase superfamily II)